MHEKVVSIWKKRTGAYVVTDQRGIARTYFRWEEASNDLCQKTVQDAWVIEMVRQHIESGKVLHFRPKGAK
jgi:hypothetical protein